MEPTVYVTPQGTGAKTPDITLAFAADTKMRRQAEISPDGVSPFPPAELSEPMCSFSGERCPGSNRVFWLLVLTWIRGFASANGCVRGAQLCGVSFKALDTRH